VLQILRRSEGSTLERIFSVIEDMKTKNAKFSEEAESILEMLKMIPKH
jgi:hypothetical protein